MSFPSIQKKCQYCDHQILYPIVSEYCTNCGKITGASKDKKADYIPLKDEVLFEVRPIFGKTSYKFFPDKMIISKGSKVLEDVPYSRFQDCEAVFQLSGSEPGATGMRVKITLKGNPPRELDLPYNPLNNKLEADLIIWLNIKLAENS